MKKLITTLLIIKKENKILLANKKRGFGEGKLNGVGGKLQPNETVEQAMIRETIEEIGVTPTVYKHMAIINFDEIVKGERCDVEMNIFLATKYDGTPVESEEMCPSWFDIDNIPFDRMFADDYFWLPEILKGNKVKGDFVYDENFNITSKHIEIVEAL